MERVGSGISFMIDQMRQLGRPDPQFRDQGEFVVIFFRSSSSENDERASAPAKSSPSLSTPLRQKRSRPTRHFYPASQGASIKRKKQKLVPRYASGRSKEIRG